MNVVSVNDGSSPLEVGNLTVVDDVGVNATDSQSVTVTPVVHVCGNGIRSTAEQCDDNNTIGGDGCDSLCVVETGFACTSSTEQDGGSGVGGLDTCAALFSIQIFPPVLKRCQNTRTPFAGAAAALRARHARRGEWRRAEAAAARSAARAPT